jgi:hypothetical protein
MQDKARPGVWLIAMLSNFPDSSPHCQRNIQDPSFPSIGVVVIQLLFQCLVKSDGELAPYGWWDWP